MIYRCVFLRVSSFCKISLWSLLVLGQLMVNWPSIFQLVTHLYHVEFSLALIIFPRNHHDGPRVPRSICGWPIGLLLWWEIHFFCQILSFDSPFWTIFPKSTPSGLSTSFENRKEFSLICFQGLLRWKQSNGPQSPREELNLFLSNILVSNHISHFSGNKETSRKVSPWWRNEQFILKLFCLELFILVFRVEKSIEFHQSTRNLTGQYTYPVNNYSSTNGLQ